MQRGGRHERDRLVYVCNRLTRGVSSPGYSDGRIMTQRRIRVHLAGHATFVITTEDGIVVSMSDDSTIPMEGWDEKDAANYLRSHGATFVDLEGDRSIVQVRRGYRSRNTRPKTAEGKEAKRELADRSQGRRKHTKKPTVTHYGESATMASLRMYDGRPIEDIDLRDCPF